MLILLGIMTILLRYNVRKSKDLTGNILKDCLAVALCYPFALCQMSIETEVNEIVCGCEYPEPEYV